MAWLVTHMWMTLLAVGLAALVLGWSVRGMLVVGKLRRARVDRDVAQTELAQARDEIDGLYEAQRKALEEEGAVPAQTLGPVEDSALRSELDEREARLSTLTEELARSKAELEKLKANGARSALAGAVSGGAAALATPPAADAAKASEDRDVDGEAPTLLWRNRHLETRVQHLEATINELHASVTEAETPSAVEARVTDGAPPADAGTSVADDKLRWQADYLRQRVGVLESLVAAAPVPAIVSEEAAIIADEAPSGTLTAAMLAPAGDAPDDAFAPDEGDTEFEEELASLRWRNRYLEGRLAYYEGDDAGEIEEADADAVSNIDDLIPDMPATEVDDSGDTLAAFAAVGAAVTATSAAHGLEGAGAEDNDAREAETVEDDASAGADRDERVQLASGDVGFESEPEPVVDVEAEEAPASAAILDVLETADAETEQDNQGIEPGLAASDAPDTDRSAGEVSAGEAIEGAGETEPETDAAEDPLPAAAEAVAPAPTVTQSIEPEKPLALDGPVGGQADDLTVIGGVGPKIQEVLNDLGIFHYDQIADWSDENVAWVDDHLSFSGRIARERWVEQAQVLAGDT